MNFFIKAKELGHTNCPSCKTPLCSKYNIDELFIKSDFTNKYKFVCPDYMIKYKNCISIYKTSIEKNIENNDIIYSFHLTNDVILFSKNNRYKKIKIFSPFSSINENNINNWINNLFLPDEQFLKLIEKIEILQ